MVELEEDELEEVISGKLPKLLVTISVTILTMYISYHSC